MRVLDLRSAPVRRFSRPWEGGTDSPPGVFARAAGRLTDAVTAGRVNRRPAPPRGPRLVSVGNLAVGGTGKTPVVMALAGDLAALGRRGAVLTRGFGSSLRGPVVVSRDNAAAGDEARLMAWRLTGTGWPVVQSRNRPAGLAWIMASFPDLDYVLLEDAHQTAGLPRHLDILLLDRWTVDQGSRGPVLTPVTGPVFPFGPWRETDRGAGRAGVFLVETAGDLPAHGPAGQTVAGFQRRQILSRPHGAAPRDLAGTDYALLSGIARPLIFEESVRETQGGRARLAIRCRDHAPYESQALDKVVRAMQEARVTTLVTTLKDWVKLDGKLPAELDVVLVDLKVEWGRATALPHVVEERLERWDGTRSG